MKKLALVFIFMLATSSLVNASSNVMASDYVDCDAYADVTQGIALMNGWSYGDSLSIWADAYSSCVSYNMANLVEVEEFEDDDWD